MVKNNYNQKCVMRIKFLIASYLLVLTLLPLTAMGQNPITRQNAPKEEVKIPPKPAKVLKVNGLSNGFPLTKIDLRREQKFDVYCSDGDYSIKDVPRWCRVTNKTNKGFSISAVFPNRSIEDLRDYIVIEGAGKKIHYPIVHEGELLAEINGVTDTILNSELILDVHIAMRRQANSYWKEKDFNRSYSLYAFFYDNDGKPLVNRDSSAISTYRHFSYQRGHSDIELSIPLYKLHKTNLFNNQMKVGFLIKIWNEQGNGNIVARRSPFTLKLPEVEFFINGKSVSELEGLDGIFNYDSGGGSKHFAVKATYGYSVDSIPDWCYIQNKSNSGFDLFCYHYNSVVGRTGSVVVSSAGRKIRLFISQSSYAMETLKRKRR